MSIEAVMIDSREPDWVQKLTFGGVPTAVTMLEHGDLQVACSDGATVLIERKTPTDLLNTLKDDRLFPQLAGLANCKIGEQVGANGNHNTWTYLMVTGELQRSQAGHVITAHGETGWNWDAVQGALLSVQEMGVSVIYCASDTEYQNAVIRLCARSHDPAMQVFPPRAPQILGQSAVFLAGLPGIGPERVMSILRSASTPAWALVALTDEETVFPGIAEGTKNRIRKFLGLKNNEQITVINDNLGREKLAVAPLGSQ